jgi:hypothetical protein
MVTAPSKRLSGRRPKCLGLSAAANSWSGLSPLQSQGPLPGGPSKRWV